MMTKNKKYRSQTGNVVFTLFGALAVVGAIGAGTMSILQGPVSSMVKANKKEITDTRMELNTRLLVKDAINRVNQTADCDGDNFIEAPEWRDASGAGPTGGGFLPDTMGTTTIDPWGSEYGYCVWDHGSVTVAGNDPECGGAAADRLEGGDDDSHPYVAVISAGPDRNFQTSCADWVDVGPADGNPDTPLLTKISGSDDLVFTFTYAQAEADMGDYWVFGSDDSATDVVVETDMNIDFAGDVTLDGTLDLDKMGGGLILEDMAGATCDAAKNEQLFMDSAQTPPSIVICDGAGNFDPISGTSAAANGDLDNGLLHHWRFDDGAGTTLTDELGTRDGTFLNGAPTWRVGGGISGSALEFDGDDSIDLGAFGNSQFLSTHTVSAWVKGDAGGISGTIFHRGYGNNVAYNPFFASDRYRENGVVINYASNPFTDGGWHHIVIRRNGSDMDVFIDGVLDVSGTAVSTGVSNFSRWCIGAYYGASSFCNDGYFDGLIDELRFYDRAISNNEIVALYNKEGVNVISDSESDYDPNLTLHDVGEGPGNPARVVHDNEHHFSELWGQGVSFSNHSCGIKKGDGSVWCWGRNNQGQLGNGTYIDPNPDPVQAIGIYNAIDLATSNVSSCAILENGEAWCWGWDGSGLLGNGAPSGTFENSNIPVQVINVPPFVKIAASDSSFCALTDDGEAWCWGGLGSTHEALPVEGNITDWISIAVNNTDSACGVRSNGEIWCWGNDNFGSLGRGTTGVNSSTPVKTQTNVKFTKVFGGREHYCAISTEKEVYCWGRAGGGSIGDGTGLGRNVPTKVDDAEQDYIDLALGNFGSIGLKSDGRIFHWGAPYYGAEFSPGSNALSPALSLDDNYIRLFKGSNTFDFYVGYGIHRSTTPGEQDAPEAPYAITQNRNAGHTMESYGLTVDLNSTTNDDRAGIGFAVDSSSTGPGDTLSASIEAVRKGGETAGILFGAQDSGGYGRALYMDPQGQLQVGSSVTNDVLAALQLDTHAAAHGGWSSDYQNGLLVTRDEGGTNQIAYFGLEDSTGHATILFSKDFLIEHSNDDASTTNSVLHLQDAGVSTFFGAIDFHNTGGGMNIHAYSDTADDHPMYKFERSQGTPGAPSNVSIGDVTGAILFEGYDGTSTSTSGHAAIYGTSVAGAGAPVDLTFGADPAGSAKSNDTLRITSTGEISISGVASPDTLLHVGGRMGSDAGVQVSNDVNCSGSNDEGTLRFNGSSIEYCDGSGWSALHQGSCTEKGATFYDMNVMSTDDTCFLYSTGEVSCIGKSENGESGDGSTLSKRVAIPIEKSQTDHIVKLFSDGANACGIRDDGTVRCWGDNDFGQLGKGDAAPGTESFYPVDVIGMTDVVSGSTGQGSSCFIRDNGSVWCTGHTEVTGSGTNIGYPIQIRGLSKVIKVVEGFNRTCVLLEDGTVRCWGAYVGDGTATTYIDPTEPTGLTNIVDITATGIAGSKCAVKDDGTVWCWGVNDDGEVGNGLSGVDILTPTQIPAFTDVIQIDAGHDHVCATKDDGTVWCWGNNGFGQLGLGFSGADQLSPQQVINVNNAIKVSAGKHTSCALLDDGNVKCWGDDFYGQAGGAGANSTILTPATVPNPLGGCHPKYVFVADARDGNMGGLTGADAICQAEADAAGLPGIYKAWLSDNTDSPSTRFTQSEYGYINTRNEVIATDWADLTDGTINVPLNITEFGAQASGGSTWTGSLSDGTANGSGSYCGDWTSTAGTERRGANNVTNSGWSDAFSPTACTSTLPFYCFQQ